MNNDPALLSTTEGRELGRILSGVLDRLDRLESAQRSSQLERTSLHNGSLAVHDSNGLRQRVGIQDDGAYTVVEVNAPPPPEPTAPIVAALPGGFTVRWDGGFTSGGGGSVPRPSDWRRVDVHVDLDPGFEATFGTVDAAILVPDGATLHFTTSDYTAHHVRLVAVNGSGEWSTPTDPVTVTPGQITEGDVAPGAVGAVQLADGAVQPQHLTAELVLASQVIAGDPDAARVTLDGLANELTAHQVDGTTRTFLLDGDTGDVEIIGRIATAPAGARIVFNEEFTSGGVAVPSVRAVVFRGTGVKAVYLYSGDTTDSTGTAGMYCNLARSWAAGGTQDYPVVGIDDRVRLAVGHAGVDGSGNGHHDYLAVVLRLASGITMNGWDTRNEFWYTNAYLPSGTIAAADSPQLRYAWLFKDSGGTVTQKCGIAAQHPTGTIGPGIVFANCTSMSVVSLTGSAWAPISASAFTVNSATTRKRRLDRLPGSALTALRQAPPYTFRYTEDPDEGPARIGPLAEDLPPWLRTEGMTLPGVAGDRGTGTTRGTQPGEFGEAPQVPLADQAPPRPEGDPVDAGAGYDLVRWVNALAEAVRELDEELDVWRTAVGRPLPFRRRATRRDPLA